MTQVTTPLPQNEAPVKQLTHSERFTSAVEKEFIGTVGEISLTSFQKKLIKNYFIKLDGTLKVLEVKRLAKKEQYRDPLPFKWEYINMQKMAIDVVAYSSVGLDPLQTNHINIIPFKNNATNTYDCSFIVGYKGAEIKARKYGLDIPDNVIVELVYKNDKFKQIKRDLNNKIESYEFEIVDDFNRGELVGGFYYHAWNENPEKNKIRVFSKADIDKRRPDHASPEFWGGERDKWENGQKVGKEVVEGWYDEMAYKTIYRSAFNSITIDSEKIDQAFLNVLKRESDRIPADVAKEIASNANQAKDKIGFDDEEEPMKPEEKNEQTKPQILLPQDAPADDSAQQSSNTKPNQSEKKAPF